MYLLVESWSGLREFVQLGPLPPSFRRELRKKGHRFGFSIYASVPAWMTSGLRSTNLQGVLGCLDVRNLFSLVSGWGQSGMPSSFSSCSREVTGMSEQRLLSEFPRATPRHAPLEHPFGTKCVGRAGLSLHCMS